LAIKENENLSFPAMWMELEDSMLSEISQAQKNILHVLHSYVKAKKLISRKQKVE
jgi:hypothetical protein